MKGSAMTAPCGPITAEEREGVVRLSCACGKCQGEMEAQVWETASARSLENLEWSFRNTHGEVRCAS